MFFRVIDFFTNPYCCSCCCCFSLHSTRFSGVVYVLGWEGEKASEYFYSNVCLLEINQTSQPNHTPKINRKNNNQTVQQQKLNKWKLQQNNAWTNALPWNTIVMTNNYYNNNCHKKGTFVFFVILTHNKQRASCIAKADFVFEIGTSL